MSILLLENYIKYILKENKEFTTKLHVYDFDATLFSSPKAPEEWKTKNAKTYWWNSSDSLNSNVVNSDVSHLWIEEVVSEARKSISDMNTLAILCTARIEKPEVMYMTSGLLREKGLRFEKLFFKPEAFSGSTGQYKAGVVKMLLNACPYITEVVFWEDNKNNLNAVKDLIDKKDFYKRNRDITYLPKLVN
tara:strand:- start:5051 stop:5623 length:573 start_codon:yes stop_codon:yes gene_type:complete